MYAYRMVCASTKTSVTKRTGETPGMVRVRSSFGRSPRSWPGKSGTPTKIHTRSTTVSTVIDRNATRQPSQSPRKVPAGTPRESATGIPAIAMAIALPWRCTGARRRAYPASRAQARPAATPATNRATIVSS